jgi:hypothetical protein
MATAPTTAAIGGTITAAKYNEIPANLTDPAAYSPTITNWASATTGPTTTGRYWITGRMCHVLVQSKLGTGAITVGSITVTLPFAMDTTGMILNSTGLNGNAIFNDVSAGTPDWGGLIQVVDANTIRLMREASATTGNFAFVTSALPFVWATLDQFSAAFVYPLA